MATQGDTDKSDNEEASSWWRDLVESARTCGRENDLEWLHKQAVLRDPTGNYRNQALISASGHDNAEGVELMLTLGARVNSYSKIGVTSLHEAAARGHTQIVNTLIAHGADTGATSSVVSARNVPVVGHRSADMPSPSDGITPLMLAAGTGHLDVVKVLLSYGADVGAKDSEGLRAVAYASIRGQKGVVKALVSHQAASTSTPSTAEDGRGPDKRASSKDGAAGGASYPATPREVDGALPILVEAASAGDEAKVDEVLRSSPELDVNARLAGKTALMEAVEEGHVGVVRKLLVEYRADPNVIWEDGLTCLMMAAGKDDELVRLLLAHGANAHVKDSYGGNAVFYAVISADVNALRSLKVLKAHGANLTATNNKGVTALMMAAYGGSMQVVQYLLANGVDPTARDGKGKDAMAWAKWALEGRELVNELSEAVKAHVERLAAQIEGPANGEAQVHKDKNRKKKHRRKNGKGQGAARTWDVQAGGDVGGISVDFDAVAAGVEGGGDGGEEQQLQQVTAAVAVSCLHEGPAEPAAEEAEAQDSATVAALSADTDGTLEAALAVELTEEDMDEAPALFECPISHTIMRDPVAACDGYSYERSHIETWISKAAEDGVALRSPMTNEAMEAGLNRNLVLKFLVDEYVQRKFMEKKARLTAVAAAANA